MDMYTVLSNSIILKLREKKHRIFFSKKNNLMKEAMHRFSKCQYKKPNSQIKREIKLCKDYWGCYPMHYYRYDLYRKDKYLTDEELVNYIPEFFFYELFLKYYDTNKFSILIEDKNVCELIFKSLNIKHPNTIFRTVRGKFYDENMNTILEKDIPNLIQMQNANKIFIKPTGGEGGKGIYAFTKKNNSIFITKDDIALDEEFINKIKFKDYLVQEGLKQDCFLSEIYGESVNTFRIATENRNGRIRILCATLRIGRNGNEVDNASQGGLVLGVDIETGETMSNSVTEFGEVYQEHPDTKFVFRKFIIPEWSVIKKFTIEAAEKLACFTYLGWDIALCEDGPLAIETNLYFGIDHYQVPFGGLKKVFNIENPIEYWNNISKKYMGERKNVL